MKKIKKKNVRQKPNLLISQEQNQFITPKPYINIESDGIIYACQIYGEDSDTPYFIFDGARHELTDEEKEALKCRM